MDEIRVRLLLMECTGDDLWSPEYCLQSGIPQTWIDELRDCYESGFRSPGQQIYFNDQKVNQFEGVRDVDLACKFGMYLGLDVSQLAQTAFTRASLVRAIQEAAEEE